MLLQPFAWKGKGTRHPGSNVHLQVPPFSQTCFGNFAQEYKVANQSKNCNDLFPLALVQKRSWAAMQTVLSSEAGRLSKNMLLWCSMIFHAVYVDCVIVYWCPLFFCNISSRLAEQEQIDKNSGSLSAAATFCVKQSVNKIQTVILHSRALSFMPSDFILSKTFFRRCSKNLRVPGQRLEDFLPDFKYELPDLRWTTASNKQKMVFRYIWFARSAGVLQ